MPAAARILALLLPAASDPAVAQTAPDPLAL
jgi:hypothetical protein